MVDTALITSLLENSRKNSIQIEELDWPNEWLKFPFYDFEVTIGGGDLQSFGRGSDRNQDLALLKACAEAVERHACKSAQIPTTGVAAHDNPVSAKHNACNELLERATLILYLLADAKMPKITPPKAFRDMFANALTRIENSGGVLRFFRLSEDEYTVLCSVDWLDSANRRGALVGLSRDGSLDKAVEGAFIEVIRNVAAVIDNPGAISPLSPAAFQLIDLPTADQRRSLTYSADFWHQFLAKHAGNHRDLALDFPRDLKVNFQVLRSTLNVPIHVNRASFESMDNDDVQYGGLRFPIRILKNLGLQGLNPLPYFLG